MNRRVRRRGAVLVVLALACAGAARAEERDPAPTLRLVHLHDGLRGACPGGDLERMAETTAYKEAREVSLDLRKPEHPLIAWRLHEGKLFYVFHKTIENAFADRPWLIQRIRKTERTWTSKEGPPQVKVTWQVEAFKLNAGAIKKPDQHYGSFSLRDAKRREVVKEYEFGFGEVPGTAVGTAWPWSPGTLYHLLQAYEENAGLHDLVRFSSSRRWSLHVSFDDEGTYRIHSPELGFDLPKTPPDPKDAAPAPDPASKGLVLERKVGVGEARLGEATEEDLVRLFGKPLEAIDVGQGHRNVSVAAALTFNLDEAGRLNTVITRPGFAGRTKEGLAHGDARARVLEVLGSPRGQRADAGTWTYEGLVVTFDGFDRVSRLVVSPR